MRCLDSCRRTPESKKWKLAKILFNQAPDVSRLGVDVKEFAAIGGIHRAGGNGIIRSGVHVKPPEYFCAGKMRDARAQFIPDFICEHEVIGLLPKMHLG